MAQYGPPSIGGSIDSFVDTAIGGIRDYQTGQALQNLPKTPDGSVDYRAAAAAMYRTNPGLAAQFLKMEELKGLGDYRRDVIDVQRKQLDLAGDKSSVTEKDGMMIWTGPRGEIKRVVDLETRQDITHQFGQRAPNAPAAPQKQPTPEHIKMLQDNPALAPQFDDPKAYGPGASARILGGGGGVAAPVPAPAAAPVQSPAAPQAPVAPTGRAARPAHVQALSYDARKQYDKDLASEYAKRPQEEILKLDASTQSSMNALATLNKILDLSKTSYSGWGAGPRASAAAQFGVQSGRDTLMMDKLVQRMAVMSMKDVFGGAGITDSERRIWVELQGASSDPSQVREGLYKDAYDTIKKRIEYNTALANDLRNGTFLVPRTYEGVPQVTVTPGGR